MSKWRVYYGDGTTVESDGFPVDRVPARNVQVVVQDHPSVGWSMVHTRDFYIWADERWRGVDQFGLYDYLCEPGWKRVLFGRTINRDDFNTIYQQAKRDTKFARKSGFTRDEIKP